MIELNSNAPRRGYSELDTPNPNRDSSGSIVLPVTSPTTSHSVPSTKHVHTLAGEKIPLNQTTTVNDFLQTLQKKGLIPEFVPTEALCYHVSIVVEDSHYNFSLDDGPTTVFDWMDSKHSASEPIQVIGMNLDYRIDTWLNEKQPNSKTNEEQLKNRLKEVGCIDAGFIINDDSLRQHIEGFSFLGVKEVLNLPDNIIDNIRTF